MIGRHAAKLSLVLASTLATVSLAACAVSDFGVADKQAQAPSDAESFVVLGVSPVNYRVTLFTGKEVAGKFERDDQRTFLAAIPSDGYVVGKAHAGDVIAISGILRQRDNGISPKYFDLCGHEALVYKVPAGKVIYLGDLALESSDTHMTINHSLNESSARLHIDSNFPHLKGRLEHVDPAVMPVICPSSKTGGGVLIMRTYRRR
jgi:hypothetical protein